MGIFTRITSLLNAADEQLFEDARAEGLTSCYIIETGDFKEFELDDMTAVDGVVMMQAALDGNSYRFYPVKGINAYKCKEGSLWVDDEGAEKYMCF